MKVYIKPFTEYYCSKDKIMTQEITPDSSTQIVNECIFNCNPSVFRVDGTQEELEWFENQIIDYWNTNSYEDEPVIAISNNKSYVFHYNTFEEYGIEVQHLDRLLNFIRTANANIVYYQSKESE